MILHKYLSNDTRSVYIWSNNIQTQKRRTFLRNVLNRFASGAACVWFVWTDLAQTGARPGLSFMSKDNKIGILLHFWISHNSSSFTGIPLMVDQSLWGHLRKTNVYPMKIKQRVPECHWRTVTELCLEHVRNITEDRKLHHDLPIWALDQHVKPVLLQLSCTKQFV